MKGFGKLIGNELFKLWKQTFIRVIAIIVLVLIVLYPLCSAGLSFLVSKFAGTDSIGADVHADMEYYEAELEWADEYGGLFEARYYTVCLDACRYFADEVIADDPGKAWLYEAYGNTYVDYVLTKDALSLVDSGAYTDDELRASAYAYVLTGVYFLEDDYGEPGEVSPAYVSGLYYDAYAEEIEKLKETITRASVADYLSGAVDSLECELEYADYELYALEFALNETPDDPALQLEVSNMKRTIEWKKRLLEGYHLLVEGNYGPGTWQYRAIYRVLSNIVFEKESNLPVTEREFESESYYTDTYDSYEEYVEDCEYVIGLSDESLEIVLAAVKHNVPLPYLIRGSEKLATRSNVVTTVQLVFYLALAIGGTIIATEHSRGTIRLLLIRPSTRTRILWSKLLAGLIVIGVFSLFAFLWSSLWSVLLYGGSDFFTPEVVYSNGTVMLMPSVLSYLGVFGGTLLRVVFFYTVAFFFSVACKRTVPAIILSFVINGGLNIFASIALVLWSLFRLEGIKYLPFAYADLSMFQDSLTDYYCSVYSGMSGSLISMLTGGASNMTAGLLPAVGVVWFLGIAVLLSVFSFVIFKGRQIKD